MKAGEGKGGQIEMYYFAQYKTTANIVPILKKFLIFLAVAGGGRDVYQQ